MPITGVPTWRFDYTINDSLEISYECSFSLDARMPALFRTGLCLFFFFFEVGGGGSGFVLSYFDCKLDCQNVSSKSNTLHCWFKLGLVIYLDATTCVSFYGLEVAHQKRYQISTHLN